MIQQRIGDLLEIEEGGKYFYVVVLSKVIMFGGNILFAFHNEGQRREISSLTSECSGFNICADLLDGQRQSQLRPGCSEGVGEVHTGSE